MENKKEKSPLAIPDRLNEIIEQKKKLGIEEVTLIDKAMKSDDPNTILKAGEYWEKLKVKEQPEYKSYFVDPFMLYESLGYKDKPLALSYRTLERMARAPIIRSIIGTRVEQVASFSTPQSSDSKIGWMIRKRQGLFQDKKKKELNNQEKKTIEELTNFVLDGGSVNRYWHGDDFESFLRKVTPDSLIYDQMCWENVFNRKKLPTEFVAVDGATFRLAESEKNQDPKKMIAGYYPSYVQILDERVYAEFYPWELCFGMRNPRTNVYANGYGRSELEDLIQIVTWMLYGDAYNSNFFKQGASPKGILKLSGNVNNTRLMEFRQQWQAQIAGVQNCIAGDTTIYTKEKGIVSVENYVGEKQEEKATIWTGEEWSDGLVYRTKERKKLCITELENGQKINTSPDHKFRVIGEEGDPVWREQSELKKNDIVLVNKLIPEGDSIWEYKGQKIEEDLLEVLGWMIRDGCISSNGKNNYIRLFYHPYKEENICEKHINVLCKYGLNAYIKIQNLTEEQREKIKKRYGFKSVLDRRLEIRLNNVDFVKWLINDLGFKISKEGKEIPIGLYNLSKEYKYAFLRGIFSADGCNHKNRHPQISITYTKLRDQVRNLLNSLSIRCNRYEGSGSGRFGTKKGKKNTLYIKDKKDFFDNIGFLQDWKQPISPKKPNEIGGNHKISQVTCRKYLMLVKEKCKDLTKGQRNDINNIIRGAEGCSINRLLRFLKLADIKVDWLENYHFEKIINIERTDIEIDMFDASVNDEKHQFIANNMQTHNSWKTPVIESDKMEWVDLQKTNVDMQFSQWQEYLLKLSCSIYKIDPVEIGFPINGGLQQKSSLFEASQQVRLEYSQEKGLKPLLRFIQRKMNKYIINLLDPEYEFMFTGLDIEDEEKRLEQDIKKSQSFQGFKEVREERGLPGDLPDDDLILNPTWMQWKMQQQMGSQESNWAVDRYGEGEEENPFAETGQSKEEENSFQEEKEVEKSVDSDPFKKDFDQYIDLLVEDSKIN